MVKDQIKKDLEKVLSKLKIAEEVEVTRTAKEKFGDFSTNLALRLRSGQALRLAQGSPRAFTPRGKPSKTPIREQSSLEIAKLLTDSLKKQPYVKKLEVVAPGFVNFFIKEEVWQKEIASVLKLGPKFGSNNSGKGKKVQVEFISANPTGPLTLGNGRGGFMGDAISKVLEFSGYQVEREYYVNDAGWQVYGVLGNSIRKAARLKSYLMDGTPHYSGKHIVKIAKSLKKKYGGKFESMVNELGVEAVKIIMEDYIKPTIEDIGIKFDVYFLESSLYKRSSTEIKNALAKLREQGLIYSTKDGAAWVRTTKFGDDKDRVIKVSQVKLRERDEATYFLSDIGYQWNKFYLRKFDKAIHLWGADHHGYVGRIRAIAKALGFEDKVEFIIFQLIRLIKGGQEFRMSKRAGAYVSLDDLLKLVSLDAARFFFIMHPPNSHIDFDLDLAKEKSSKNPVYYVQYAHARIHSILAKSKVKSRKSKVKSQLLTTNYELDLIKQISKLPELVEEISQSFGVHRLTVYSLELADSFHRFYENCPVLSASGDLRDARMALCRATQIALANTLNLLGVKAPDKM